MKALDAPIAVTVPGKEAVPRLDPSCCLENAVAVRVELDLRAINRAEFDSVPIEIENERVLADPGRIWGSLFLTGSFGGLSAGSSESVMPALPLEKFRTTIVPPDPEALIIRSPAPFQMYSLPASSL